MIAAVADCHVGNHRRMGGPFEAGLNARCRLVLDGLTRAVDEAYDRAHGDDMLHFFVLGDLFDSARPSPQEVAGAQEALGRKARDIACYVLVGNHDQVSTSSGDHALGPLDGYENIHVIEQPTVLPCGNVQVLAVPFQPGPAAEWLPVVVAGLAKYQPALPRVLMLHLGLIDDATPPWLHTAHDAVPVKLVEELAKEHNIGFVLAGNWHERHRWGNIMQVGALVPTGFDNPGLTGYGTVAMLHEGVLSHVELPGPRFVKATEDTLATVIDNAGDAGHKLFLELATAPARVAEEQANMDRYIQSGHVLGCEVLPDQASTESAARGAAAAAAGAGTMDEALANFVEEMPVAEGVDRGEVLARARNYLTRT